MPKVYWLSGAGFARIKPLLPRGRWGAHQVGDRGVISGIVHMLPGYAGATARPNTVPTRRSINASTAGAAKGAGLGYSRRWP
jgi:hypothetical protein